MTDITWGNDTRKLSDLVPWDINPVQMPKRAADGLTVSLHKFGFAQPLLVGPDGELYDGHQRQNVMAAMEEFGPDAVVDVRVSSRPLTEDERKELAIRLRKNTGDFDFDILANSFEVDDLLEWGFEPFELGMDETPDTAGEDTEPQTNRADELREQWGVEAGQMWRLPSAHGGEHRLICGDCTDADVVARVMGGERAGMVFTDAPYNVASHSKNFAADVSGSMQELKNSDWDQNFNLVPALHALESAMAHDVTVYICTSYFLAHVIWTWMDGWAAHHSWCAWHKPNPMPSLSKRHWTWDGELIPYATRGKHTFNFPEHGHAASIWSIPKQKDTDHPTEKPVPVPEMAISHSSNAGDIVFDGFAGSGTTIIACENLARQCRAIEISPAYCAVILQRYADHTGITPELVEA